MSDPSIPVTHGLDASEWQAGNEVMHGEVRYRIESVLDSQFVLAVEASTQRQVVLASRGLRAAPQQAPPKPPPPAPALASDVYGIGEAQWGVATARYEAIKPLLNQPGVGKALVRARAAEVGVDPATLYRWLGRYNAYGVVSALVPRPRGWRTGHSRLSGAQDQVITRVLEVHYLTKQRISQASAISEVMSQCRKEGIARPSETAVRERIAALPEYQVLSARGEDEKARNKFNPVPGYFPGADYPLAVVQADHTPMDVVVVDDELRRPIGRPFITTIQCIYSRMILGYYLSLDAPSVTSVGLALVHAMLPKEEWLELHGVDADWPVWGKPKTLHFDNGGDFRAHSLQRSCTEHGIHLEYRPVATPNFGGTVERVIGTMMRQVHEIPGTTFSSIKEKGNYNSEKEAALSLKELERYIMMWICRVYNARKHRTLGMSPIAKWSLGLHGTEDNPGVGLRERPANPERLMFDFLPRFERTIQTFGVSLDGRTYYDNVLRPYINATDPKTKQKRKFIFRRDPRDISVLWFFHPDANEEYEDRYRKIPFAQIKRARLSLWEQKQVNAALKKMGVRDPSDDQFFDALDQMRAGVIAAQEKTSQARKQRQKWKNHEKSVNPADPLASIRVKPEAETLPETEGDLLMGDIQPFGDDE